jgi:hypothetical protein
MPSMQAASWTLVCILVVAGFGFLVTRSSGSSSSSAPSASTSSQPTSAAAGGDEPQSASGRASLSPEHSADKPAASGRTGFLVYSTGTAYERATLAGQVRDQLASFGGLAPTTPANSASAAAPAASASAAAPAASASASAASSSVGGAAPSPQLSGCVAAVTGGLAPSLVDRASYDGIPAYIIAVPTEVWVVRRGCTAADTQLLTRMPLGS